MSRENRLLAMAAQKNAERKTSVSSVYLDSVQGKKNCIWMM